MKYLRHAINIAVVLVVSAFLPALAMASTAANTTITNTVTVDYTDTASNPYQETASVDILVNLVASAPIISDPADVDPATENTGVNLIYTITSTANGPDTYDFSSVDTPTNMDGNAGSTTPSVSLGATTLAVDAVATDTFITVPFDGNSGDDIVNGIVAGETIVIGANAYVVGTIDEATTLSNNTVQIPLNSAITGATVTIGSIIGERRTVTVTITTDDITTGSSGTHSIATIATSSAPALEASATSTTLITVRRPLLTVTKYVRNVTVPVVGAGPYVFDGETWYSSGVNGKPSDVMEYLILVDNTDAGATQADNIVISDPIPQFTTLVSAFNVLLDDDGTAADLASFVEHDIDVDGTDAAELSGAASGGTVYVYAGVGGDDTTAGAGVGDGGSLAQGEISRVIFRVTID